MIILLFFLLQHAISQISFSFSSVNNYIIIENFPIGTPNQNLKLLIDTTSMETWVPHAKLQSHFELTFNPEHSSTINQTKSSVSFTYKNLSLIARPIIDVIGKDKNFMTIGLINTIDIKTGVKIEFSGVLGLRPIKKTQASKYSFIESLYANGLISYTTMKFYYTSREKGKIIFGEEIKKQNYLEMCKSLSTDPDFDKADPMFHCSIVKVDFDKKEPIHYSGSKIRYIIFDTSSRYILVPTKELMVIFLKFVSISENKCKIDSENEGNPFLSCEDDFDITKLPSISFSLTNITIEVLPRELFDHVNNEYYCKLNISNEENLWYLGEPLMKNYKFSFDYDNDMVYIEEDLTHLHEVTATNSKISFWDVFKYILILLLIALIILVIYYFVLRMKKRKNEMYIRTTSSNLIDMNFQSNISLGSIKELMPN